MKKSYVLGPALRLGGRLFQQYVVDAYSSIESCRLWWVKQNQKTLRNEVYKNLVDLLSKGDTVDPSNVGQGYILPSSFVGSGRYMQQNYMDSLAVCRKIGYPSLFLTITCSQFWDEIEQMKKNLPPCNTEDIPDIISRVFKLKLDQICDIIKKNPSLGSV